MNKDIKFKVWDKTQSRIFEVTSIHWDYEDKPRIFSAREIHQGAILLQYTGLHDKTGKEIYEGDILKYHDPLFNFKPEQIHIGVVLWRENSGGFICERRLIDGKAVKPEYGMSGIEFKWQGQVIGNIYENPELILEEVKA